MTDNQPDADELYEADIESLESRTNWDTDVSRKVDNILHAQARLDLLLGGMGRALAHRLEERRRRTKRMVTSAVLLAAGIAGIFLIPKTWTPAVETQAPQPVSGVTGLDVESPNRFAVFPTENPSISVVWIFQEE